MIAEALQALIDEYWPRWRVRRMRRTPAAAATENALIRVDGEVSARAMLRAPLSGRACGYYRLEVFSPEGRTVKEQRSAGEVVVRDETGCAIISPKGRLDFLCGAVEGRLPAQAQLGVRGAPAGDAATEYALCGRASRSSASRASRAMSTQRV